MAFLENNRLRLRALEPEDLDVLYKWENDTELWRYGSTLAPYSRFTLKEYLADSRLDIYTSRQLRLMLTLKSGNIPVGTIDLYDFDPMNRKAAVGILIDKDYRQQGLASEALNLMEEYAFGFLMLKQLYAYVPERNVVSVRLFEHCRYKRTGHLIAWIKNNDVYEDTFFMQLINNK